MTAAPSPVIFRQMNGFIDLETRPTPPMDAVILSNIVHGGARSRGARGVCIRFVARGCEDYRIDGRGYRLGEGELMICAHDRGAEVDIRRTERDGTLGLCVLLAGTEEDAPWEFGPLVVSAECSALGSLMRHHVGALRRSPHAPQLASQLVAGLRAGMPAVTSAVTDQSARIDAAKPSTRYELVRRASLAQAYLHSDLSRAIDLDELGRAVGSSPFQLLRAFQHCFGQTPAGYHRRLRLERALAEARRRGISIEQVADDYGFAGASSFSHAYRRAFGCSPTSAAAELSRARAA